MRMTLELAVESVPDGASVYLGNFGAQLFAVGHEMIRQSKRDITVITPSGGILLDQLIAEGVTSSVTISHCWNPVGPAATAHFRTSVERGELELRELSFGALCAALLAAAWGVPFMPTTDLRETGYVIDDRAAGMLGVATSSFGESPVVRAIAPDIAFVHADAASPSGNAWLSQPNADVLLAAQAARRTVVVAEGLVGERRSDLPAIPALLVDTVVISPGAVLPDGSAGRYARDVASYERYTAAARTADGLAIWRAGTSGLAERAHG